MRRARHFVRNGWGILIGSVLLVGTWVSCGQVDMTAPTGSTLQIVVHPDWVPLHGGRATVTVIGYRPNGAPLPDGTVITFTATLGRVEPARAETQDGQVRVTFISGAESGTAVIQARSGPDATAEAQILVGIAAVGTLEVLTEPGFVPFGGGTVRVIARVMTQDGSPIPRIPVVFSADAGQLASNGQPQQTNARGEAYDTLTTNQQTNVTASVGTLTATVTVGYGIDNQPPIPIFTFSPLNPAAGQRVFFNGWSSYDPDGFIKRYDWDFGDGGRASGPQVSHTYRAAGLYTVVLRVTDDRGWQRAASTQINVTAAVNIPPVAIITEIREQIEDNIFCEGEQLTFDATGSYDPDGSIISYQFDFGDNSSLISSSPVVQHTYSGITDTQTFFVVLTVKDNLGATDTDTVTIQVQKC